MNRIKLLANDVATRYCCYLGMLQDVLLKNENADEVQVVKDVYAKVVASPYVMQIDDYMLQKMVGIHEKYYHKWLVLFYETMLYQHPQHPNADVAYQVDWIAKQLHTHASHVQTEAYINLLKKIWMHGNLHHDTQQTITDIFAEYGTAVPTFQHEQ
jgi:hypothetical protein